MVTLTKVTGGFLTQLEAPRSFEAHDEALVDTIWRRALRSSSLLHDGRMLTVSNVTARGIVVSPVAYRYWFAQFTVGVPLGIRPFAITGVLRLAEGYLMGRRSHALLEDGGLWEFAPSGGVQALSDETSRVIEPHIQVVVEAQEELNIEANELGAGEPFAIVENEATRVVDLVYVHRPAINFATIKARAAFAQDREYSELEEVCAPWRGLGHGRLSAAAEAIANELQLMQP